MAIIKQGPAFLRVAAPYKGWAPPLVREQRLLTSRGLLKGSDPRVVSGITGVAQQIICR
jgi:hypothetical protein